MSRPAAAAHFRMPEIRLQKFVCPPFLVPALRRATQIGMGTAMGAIFSVLCGCPLLWMPLGAALGLSLGAVAAGPCGTATDRTGMYRMPRR